MMITRIKFNGGLWIMMGILCGVSAVECHEFINKTSIVNIIPGFKLFMEDNEIRVKFNVKELLPDRAVQSRADQAQASTKKPNIMQRFASMLMMIPLLMQILSIPGALASIKMSLLKSFFVGKLALVIMLYNLLRNFRANQELVVVHQQPAQHYNHYYAPSPYNDEEDSGWFG